MSGQPPHGPHVGTDEEASLGVPDGGERAERAALADRYDQMLRLADLFEATGEDLRARSQLGAEILGDPAVTESAELAPATYAHVEEDVRAATTAEEALGSRAAELAADALALRATVRTYQWIDELQEAAYRTLGTIAGRAIGYLAPGVALGGAVVSAGVIETDALDRDGVASYLEELAANNPELLDHVASGGGGLLDGLQMRALLTAGVLAGDTDRLAARGGLAAAGVPPFAPDLGAALRDTAGAVLEPVRGEGPATAEESAAPRSIEDLMTALTATVGSVEVRKVGPGRYIAYLPGAEPSGERRLRLVGGDHSTYAQHVVHAVEAAVAGDPDAHVMLVGSAQGGVTAAEVAASAASCDFVVDQVVTAGAPSAQVPRIPEGIRVLSLEDRTDPVAVLGSLVNAGEAHRLTVVFDSGESQGDGAYVVGGRAADEAAHPELRAEIARMQQLGYLAG